jgi:hypothetical protein
MSSVGTIAVRQYSVFASHVVHDAGDYKHTPLACTQSHAHTGGAREVCSSEEGGFCHHSAQARWAVRARENDINQWRGRIIPLLSNGTGTESCVDIVSKGHIKITPRISNRQRSRCPGAATKNFFLSERRL